MDSDDNNNRKRKAEDELNEEAKRARIQYERYYTPEEEEERKQIASSVQLMVTILGYRVDDMVNILPFLSISELLAVRISDRATNDTISEFIKNPSMRQSIEPDRADMAYLVTGVQTGVYTRGLEHRVFTVRNPGYVYHVPPEILLEIMEYKSANSDVDKIELVKNRIWYLNIEEENEEYTINGLRFQDFPKLERVEMNNVSTANLILSSTVWSLTLLLYFCDWDDFVLLTQNVHNTLMLLDLYEWPEHWDPNELLNMFPRLSVLRISKEEFLDVLADLEQNPTDRRVEALLLLRPTVKPNIKARIVIVESSFNFNDPGVFRNFLTDSYYPEKEIVSVTMDEWCLTQSLKSISQRRRIPNIVNSETLKIIQVYVRENAVYSHFNGNTREQATFLTITEIESYIDQLSKTDLFPNLTTFEISYLSRNDLDINTDIVFNNRIRLIITNNANKHRLTFNTDTVLDAILRNAAAASSS